MIKKKGVVLKIDPFIEYQKHDNYGNVIGDFCNRQVIDNLIKLGYKHHGFTTGYTDEIQLRWSYYLDINRSIEDIKKGMVQYKTDSYGNIHSIIGKVSFDETKLLENINYIYKTIVKSKPQAVKGTFVENVSISTTMGPGIKIDKNSFDI